MPSVTVPRAFFASERDTVYDSWPHAFWRELLSNSLDAGASAITLRTRFSPEGSFVVDVADNGCGMDRQTVEDVYMALGRSTKGEDGQREGIGGFGRARILTTFSHQSYRIRTSDLLVSGEGGEYRIETTPRRVRGTAVSVETDAANAGRLSRALRDVLRQSSLRVPIILDLVQESPEGRGLGGPSWDELRETDGVRRFSAWSRAGRSLETLRDETGDWASLHVSRGTTACLHRGIVRVNGLAMHDEFLSAPVQITVDLVPERSREVLTASRDSLRGPFRDRLREVFGRISTETRSALRGRPAQPETLLYRSAGTPPGLAMPGVTRPDLGQETGVVSARMPEDLPQGARHSRMMEQLRDIAGTREIPDMPDRMPQVAVHVADPSPGQRSSIRRHLPETWMTDGGEGRSAELLHAAWTGACRHALETLSKVTPETLSPDDRFVTGFVFDRNMMGCHKSIGPVPHGLLVNPVDDGGRARFHLSDPASLVELAALAIHEVTHVVHSRHDEDFAGLMTDLFSRTRQADMLRAMRSEMDLARESMKMRAEAPDRLRPVGDDDGPAP